MPIIKSSRNHKNILVVSLLILFLTTVYWSLLGAVVHNNNADQLIDPLLFADFSTFNQATFPSAHTFLLKWPLFALIALSGNITSTTILITVFLSLVTVWGLFYIIYTIEKRSLVLSLIALIFASILLMVPVEPKPGALLPTNFAMLTTRNIEYIVFVLGIILAFKPNRYRILGSVGLLTILFASDRLFMMIALGASVTTPLYIWLLGQRKYLTTFLRIFIIIVCATILNYGLLAFINTSGLTNISPDGTGPYEVAFSVRDKLEALFYALMGIATNFGANPLYSVVSWREILPTLIQKAASWTSLAYAINGIAITLLAVKSTKLLRIKGLNFGRGKKKIDNENAVLLSIFFFVAAIITALLFIIASHYYPVDARYLALWLVAFLIIAPTYSTLFWKKPTVRIYVWVFLLVSIVCGLPSSYMQYQESLRAYQPDVTKNKKVNDALSQHHVKTLVGNYWRTVPISANSPRKFSINPLDTCFGPRTVLTSNAWGRPAKDESFAYLLSNQKTGTGYPSCSLKDIQDTYGTPSNKLVISGELPNPTEILLFYDYGIRPKSIKKSVPLVRTVDYLDTLPCQGKTIMQIVAHQDDDLLFMSPDLIRNLNQDDCIRTIYLTAGDHGFHKPYWISREDGAKAAYAKGLNIKQPHWKTQLYQISDKKYISVAQLKESSGKISLLFLRLPDGNLNGEGFDASKKESLSSLNSGVTTQLNSVDSQSKYSKEDLLAVLELLMKKYVPNEVRILTPDNHSTKYPDHSDHLSAGRLSYEAFERYRSKGYDSTITKYIGYPVHEKQSNVIGNDLSMKKQMFYTYGNHDKAVCTSDELCQNTAYHWYLSRQYSTP